MTSLERKQNLNALNRAIYPPEICDWCKKNTQMQQSDGVRHIPYCGDLIGACDIVLNTKKKFLKN